MYIIIIINIKLIRFNCTLSLKEMARVTSEHVRGGDSETAYQ